MSLPLNAGPRNETLRRVWFCPRDSLGPVPAADKVVSALQFEVIVSPPDSELADIALASVTGRRRLHVLEESSAQVTPSTGVFLLFDMVLSLFSFLMSLRGFCCSLLLSFSTSSLSLLPLSGIYSDSES